MKLLIDMGNTCIKWATLADGNFTATGECVHRTRGTASAMQFLSQIHTEPEQVLAANVAGKELGDALGKIVRERWKISVDFASTQAESGAVRNGYDDYRQMGVDRWLAILATQERYDRAACIVDAGTAVTIDQMDASGQHLGGIIVPGLDLMRRALDSETGDIERLAGLADNAPVADRQVYGRSTAEAINGGALSAICGLIEYCMEQLNERDGDTVLVMTGGDAERIIPQLQVAVDHRPKLVLEGLRVYAPA
jgi:type III pantothenate kinase